MIFILAIRKRNAVNRHPSAHFMLLKKSIEDASAKYFVGQLISATVYPIQMTCVSI